MKLLRYKLLLIGVLVLTSPIVIGDFRLRSLNYPLLWICIPIIVSSILPKAKSATKTILLVLSSIAYILVGSVLLLRFALCGYGQKTNEYVNKRNDNIKIIGRDFSCFGTTGDLVLYKQLSVSENIKLEIYYKTCIDYKNIDIDTTLWRSIQKY